MATGTHKTQRTDAHQDQERYNVSDMMTKPQDASTIRNLMELLDHRYEDGRSMVAPELNMLIESDDMADYLFMNMGIS